MTHPSPPPAPDDTRALESASQRLVTAFIATGLLFLLLPGTFLGVWNLIGISSAHSLTSITPASLQAHGHAQVFGWVGSFILGIGFYSLTKMQTLRRFPIRSGWTSWAAWTLGVLLRWIAGITAWHWRTLLPAAGILELAGFLLFWRAVRRHRPAQSTTSTPATSTPAWMLAVLLGTFALLLVLILQCFVLIHAALADSSPAVPHVLDQQLVVFAAWGVLVPTIWGFNARWLPIFAGLRDPDSKTLLAACLLAALGVVAAFTPWLTFSAALFLVAATLAILALHIWEPALRPAKTENIHRSFRFFLRLCYVWLVVSCLLNLWAVIGDHNGGFWGASRHALTVGFVAGMILTIGPRILPAFCGMRTLHRPSWMAVSLVLLHAGCALRVTLEPLAYEGLWHAAWKLLPVSAFVELSAVVAFAANLFATLLQPPAHITHARTA